MGGVGAGLVCETEINYAECCVATGLLPRGKGSYGDIVDNCPLPGGRADHTIEIAYLCNVQLPILAERLAMQKQSIARCAPEPMGEGKLSRDREQPPPFQEGMLITFASTVCNAWGSIYTVAAQRCHNSL